MGDSEWVMDVMIVVIVIQEKIVIIQKIMIMNIGMMIKFININDIFKNNIFYFSLLNIY